MACEPLLLYSSAVLRCHLEMGTSCSCSSEELHERERIVLSAWPEEVAKLDEWMLVSLETPMSTPSSYTGSVDVSICRGASETLRRWRVFAGCLHRVRIPR